jgi:hypothetical protein
VIPASPVRQAQQVRWAQPAQQAPKAPLGRGGPRGLLEIPHKGEVAPISSGVVGTVKKVRKTERQN